MSVKVSKSENELIIIFNYSPEKISKMKSIKGYRWDTDKKEWSVPFCYENIEMLKSLFKSEQLKFDFINNEDNVRIVTLIDEQLRLK